jgi:CXXC-20-CXXC protein
MPICQNCGEKWTWLQTIKNMFKLTCPYCGKRQYESGSSRRISSSIHIVPLMVLLPMNIWLDFSVITTSIIFIIFVLLFLGLYPYMLKLANEQEPYW